MSDITDGLNIQLDSGCCETIIGANRAFTSPISPKKFIAPKKEDEPEKIQRVENEVKREILK